MLLNFWRAQAGGHDSRSLPRWADRPARAVAAVAAVMAGTTLAVVPPAHADGGDSNRAGYAIETILTPGAADTLTTLTPAGPFDPTLVVNHTGIAMYQSTSPSFTNVSTNSGYEIAFEGSNSDLWVTSGGSTAADSHLGMMPGTSPSDTGLYRTDPNNGTTGILTATTEIAFQANTGMLWTDSSGAPKSLGLAMASGTSPSIAGLYSGGYEIAYQNAAGDLAITGTAGTLVTNDAMQPGTRPSITALQNGGYEIAYQTAAGTLATAGTAGSTNTGLVMDPTTSPSITAVVSSSSGFQIAYAHPIGDNPLTCTDPLSCFFVDILYTYGANGNINTGLGLEPFTSPSITGIALPQGIYSFRFGYVISYEDTTLRLYRYANSVAGDSASVVNTGQPMDAGSSPSSAPS